MNATIRCVDLTRNEVDYLKTAGLLPLALLERLEDVRWRSGVAGTVEVSPAMAEEFRQAFTEQLAKAGFDESYELTPEGRLLEDLIDRFDESPLKRRSKAR